MLVNVIQVFAKMEENYKMCMKILKDLKNMLIKYMTMNSKDRIRDVKNTRMRHATCQQHAGYLAPL